LKETTISTPNQSGTVTTTFIDRTTSLTTITEDYSNGDQFITVKNKNTLFEVVIFTKSISQSPEAPHYITTVVINGDTSKITTINDQSGELITNEIISAPDRYNDNVTTTFTDTTLNYVSTITLNQENVVVVSKINPYKVRQNGLDATIEVNDIVYETSSSVFSFSTYFQVSPSSIPSSFKYYILSSSHIYAPKQNTIPFINSLSSSQIIYDELSDADTFSSIRHTITDVIYQDKTVSNLNVINQIYIYIVISRYDISFLSDNFNSLENNHDYLVLEIPYSLVITDVNLPYVNVQDVRLIPFNDVFNISGSIFSSTHEVTNVKYATFTNQVSIRHDEHDHDIFQTFIETYGYDLQSLSFPIDVNKFQSFNETVTSFYNDIDDHLNMTTDHNEIQRNGFQMVLLTSYGQSNYLITKRKVDRSIPFFSDVRTKISQCRFDYDDNNTLLLDGYVFPDSIDTTSYYLFATIVSDLSNNDVKDIVLNNQLSSIVTANITQTKYFVNEQIPFIHDHTYSLLDSSKINKATVYLYATNSNYTHHHDIDQFVITPANESPFMTVEYHYSRFNDIVHVTQISAFSSFYNIESIYLPLVFTQEVNLSDDVSLKTFITSSVSVLSSSYVQTPILTNVIGNVNETISIAQAYYDFNMLSYQRIRDDKFYTLVVACIDSYGNVTTLQQSISPSVNTLTTLQANIVSCAFDYDNNNLVLSGQVIPDSNNETTYHVFATTNPSLTNEEVRGLILDGAYSSSTIMSNTITNTEDIVDLPIPYVHDVNSNIVDVNDINAVTVHLYATTTTNTPIPFDDIDTFSISPSSILPYQTVSTHYSRFNETIHVDRISMFSSFDDINKVFVPIAFTNNVDLTDTEALKAFITSSVDVLTSEYISTPVLQNTVGLVDRNVDILFAHDTLDTLDTVKLNGDESYTIIVSAMDTSSNLGLLEHVIIPSEQTLTTLQTNIVSCAFDYDNNNLVLSGQVIPDSNNETTYHILATTNPSLTNETIRTLVLDGSYTSTIISNVITATEDIVNLPIPFIHDVNSNIVDVKDINTATVHLYAINSNTPIPFDDIDTFSISPSSILPYQTVSTHYSRFNEIIHVDRISMFSSFDDINKVFVPIALTNNVDLTDTEALKAFITSSVDVLSSEYISTPVLQNTVGLVNSNVDILFAYDTLNTLNTIQLNGDESYTIIVSAMDTSSNLGLLEHVVTPSNETLTTLQTRILNSEFDELDNMINVQYQIIPDESFSNTEYYILATTNNNLTNEEVRSILQGEEYSQIVYNNSVTQTETLTSKLYFTLDISSNVVSNELINYANVYLYATNSNLPASFDDIDKFTIAPVNTLQITVNIHYSRFSKSLLVSDLTIFSSLYDIELVYTPIAFTSNVDTTSTNTTILSNFISSHIDALPSDQANTPITQGSLNNINDELVIPKAYDTYDISSLETFTEDQNYTVIISTKDSFNNVGFITKDTIPVDVALTNLKTTITSCVFADDGTNILLSGEVVPDSNNSTAYYVLATTNPHLTNHEVRDLILSDSYSSSIVSDITSDTLDLIDLSIPYALDMDSNIVNMNQINYANIHLYATNSNAPSTFDDIDTFTINPADSSLQITLSTYYSLFYETINITELTLFSSYTDTKVVYTPFVLVYGIYVDYTNPLFENFVTTHIPPLDIGGGKPFISQYSVSRFIDISIDSAYRQLDVNTKEYLNNSENYIIMIVTKDSDDNINAHEYFVSPYIPYQHSLGTLKTTIQSSQFDYVSNSIKITGNLIPDADNESAYYALGTTASNLTYQMVRELILSENYNDVIVKNTTSTTINFTDLEIHGVLDVNSNNVNINEINYANVYLYGTNSNRLSSLDDIDRFVISPTTEAPFIQFDVTHDSFTKEIFVRNLSYFSSFFDIQTIYNPLLLSSNVYNHSDEVTLSTFVDNNIGYISNTTIEKLSVHTITEISSSNVYSNLISQGNNLSIENSSKYMLILPIKDDHNTIFLRTESIITQDLQISTNLSSITLDGDRKVYVSGNITNASDVSTDYYIFGIAQSNLSNIQIRDWLQNHKDDAYFQEAFINNTISQYENTSFTEAYLPYVIDIDNSNIVSISNIDEFSVYIYGTNGNPLNDNINKKGVTVQVSIEQPSEDDKLLIYDRADFREIVEAVHNPIPSYSNYNINVFDGGRMKNFPLEPWEVSIHYVTQEEAIYYMFLYDYSGFVEYESKGGIYVFKNVRDIYSHYTYDQILNVLYANSVEGMGNNNHKYMTVYLNKIKAGAPGITTIRILRLFVSDGSKDEIFLNNNTGDFIEQLTTSSIDENGIITTSLTQSDDDVIITEYINHIVADSNIISIEEIKAPVTQNNVTTLVANEKNPENNSILRTTTEILTPTEITLRIENITADTSEFKIKTIITETNGDFRSWVEVSESDNVNNLITTVTSHKYENSNVFFTSTFEVDNNLDTKTTTEYNVFDKTAFEYRIIVTDLSDQFISNQEILQPIVQDNFTTTETVHFSENGDEIYVSTEIFNSTNNVKETIIDPYDSNGNILKTVTEDGRADYYVMLLDFQSNLLVTSNYGIPDSNDTVLVKVSVPGEIDYFEELIDLNPPSNVLLISEYDFVDDSAFSNIVKTVRVPGELDYYVEHLDSYSNLIVTSNFGVPESDTSNVLVTVTYPDGRADYFTELYDSNNNLLVTSNYGVPDYDQSNVLVTVNIPGEVDYFEELIDLNPPSNVLSISHYDFVDDSTLSNIVKTVRVPGEDSYYVEHLQSNYELIVTSNFGVPESDTSNVLITVTYPDGRADYFTELYDSNNNLLVTSNYGVPDYDESNVLVTVNIPGEVDYFEEMIDLNPPSNVLLISHYDFVDDSTFSNIVKTVRVPDEENYYVEHLQSNYDLIVTSNFGVPELDTSNVLVTVTFPDGRADYFTELYDSNNNLLITSNYGVPDYDQSNILVTVNIPGEVDYFEELLDLNPPSNVLLISHYDFVDDSTFSNIVKTVRVPDEENYYVEHLQSNYDLIVTSNFGVPELDTSNVLVTVTFPAGRADYFTELFDSNNVLLVTSNYGVPDYDQNNILVTVNIPNQIDYFTELLDLNAPSNVLLISHYDFVDDSALSNIVKTVRVPGELDYYVEYLDSYSNLIVTSNFGVPELDTSNVLVTVTFPDVDSYFTEVYDSNNQVLVTSNYSAPEVETNNIFVEVTFPNQENYFTAWLNSNRDLMVTSNYGARDLITSNLLVTVEYPNTSDYYTELYDNNDMLTKILYEYTIDSNLLVTVKETDELSYYSELLDGDDSNIVLERSDYSAPDISGNITRTVTVPGELNYFTELLSSSFDVLETTSVIRTSNNDNSLIIYADDVNNTTTYSISNLGIYEYDHTLTVYNSNEYEYLYDFDHPLYSSRKPALRKIKYNLSSEYFEEVTKISQTREAPFDELTIHRAFLNVSGETRFFANYLTNNLNDVFKVKDTIWALSLKFTRSYDPNQRTTDLFRIMYSSTWPNSGLDNIMTRASVFCQVSNDGIIVLQEYISGNYHNVSYIGALNPDGEENTVTLIYENPINNNDDASSISRVRWRLLINDHTDKYIEHDVFYATNFNTKIDYIKFKDANSTTTNITDVYYANLTPIYTNNKLYDSHWIHDIFKTALEQKTTDEMINEMHSLLNSVIVTRSTVGNTVTIVTVDTRSGFEKTMIIYDNGVSEEEIRDDQGIPLSKVITDGKVYHTYVFNYHIQSGYIDAVSHFVNLKRIKVNADEIYLEDWEHFVELNQLFPPQNEHTVNSILSGTSCIWDSGVGQNLFEIITTARITEFRLNTLSRNTTPGWRIYEDDVLVFSDTTNQYASGIDTLENIWLYYPLEIPADIKRIAGTGWRLIRQIPKKDAHNINYWFSGDENFTDVEDHHELLFITGDYQKWLIANRNQVAGENYGSQYRNLISSSLNPDAHQVVWYNRSDILRDPLIKLSQSGITMFYENGTSENNAQIDLSGNFVYVRPSALVNRYPGKYKFTVELTGSSPTTEYQNILTSLSTIQDDGTEIETVRSLYGEVVFTVTIPLPDENGLVIVNSVNHSADDTITKTFKEVNGNILKIRTEYPPDFFGKVIITEENALHEIYVNITIFAPDGNDNTLIVTNYTIDASYYSELFDSTSNLLVRTEYSVPDNDSNVLKTVREPDQFDYFTELLEHDTENVLIRTDYDFIDDNASSKILKTVTFPGEYRYFTQVLESNYDVIVTSNYSAPDNNGNVLVTVTFPDERDDYYVQLLDFQSNLLVTSNYGVPDYDQSNVLVTVNIPNQIDYFTELLDLNAPSNVLLLSEYDFIDDSAFSNIIKTVRVPGELSYYVEHLQSNYELIVTSNYSAPDINNGNVLVTVTFPDGRADYFTELYDSNNNLLVTSNYGVPDYDQNNVLVTVNIPNRIDYFTELLDLNAPSNVLLLSEYDFVDDSAFSNIIKTVRVPGELSYYVEHLQSNYELVVTSNYSVPDINNGNVLVTVTFPGEDSYFTELFDSSETLLVTSNYGVPDYDQSNVIVTVITHGITDYFTELLELETSNLLERSDYDFVNDILQSDIIKTVTSPGELSYYVEYLDSNYELIVTSNFNAPNDDNTVLVTVNISGELDYFTELIHLDTLDVLILSEYDFIDDSTFSNILKTVTTPGESNYYTELLESNYDLIVKSNIEFLEDGTENILVTITDLNSNQYFYEELLNSTSNLLLTTEYEYKMIPITGWLITYKEPTSSEYYSELYTDLIKTTLIESSFYSEPNDEGYILRTVTEPNELDYYVEYLSNDQIQVTSNFGVPDLINNNVAVTVNYPGIESFYIEFLDTVTSNIIVTSNYAAPDPDVLVTVTETAVESYFTLLLDVNTSNILIRSDYDAPDSSNNVMRTVTEPPDLDYYTELLNSNNDVLLKINYSEYDVELDRTEFNYFPNGDIETIITQPDGSSVSTLRDSSNNVLLTTTTSSPDNATGEITIIVTNPDGTKTITKQDSTTGAILETSDVFAIDNYEKSTIQTVNPGEYTLYEIVDDNDTVLKRTFVNEPEGNGNIVTDIEFYSFNLDSIARYDMITYDTSTNKLYDRTDFNHHLDVNNSPSINTANNAIMFDGANDYMRLNNLNNPQGAWSHSVSFWLYVPSTSGAGSDSTWSHAVFFIGNTAELQASIFKYKKNASNLVWCWDFWNSQLQYTENASFYDNWHQMVLTYNGDTNIRKVYVDGVKRSGSYNIWGGATATTKLNLTANTTLEIGRDKYQNFRYFEGRMRHFQIFNRELGIDELNILPKLYTNDNNE
jgi:hypothetical protein